MCVCVYIPVGKQNNSFAVLPHILYKFVSVCARVFAIKNAHMLRQALLKR